MRNNLIAAISCMTLLTGCEYVTAHDLRQQYLYEQQLKEQAENAKEQAYDFGNTVKDRAADAYDAAKEGAGDTIDIAQEKAGEAAEKASEAASNAADKVNEAASDAADKAVDKASELADGAKEAASTGAEYVKEDTRELGNSILDDWHDVLNALTDGGESSIKTETSGNVPKEVIPPAFGINDVPAYSGSTCVTINGNTPFFSSEDLTTEPFELYSSLDKMGRCGTAYANICTDIMPTGDRGDIGMIKPTGWKQNKYEGIIDEDPPYLYNRCHLIAYSLAGENANPKNLITGTRQFNIETGMEQYELQVLSYVRSTKNHVLYRVTPVFNGNDLLATGVLMEARSVEDNGISFCTFVYNVQEGIYIDYSTGDNRLA